METILFIHPAILMQIVFFFFRREFEEYSKAQNEYYLTRSVLISLAIANSNTIMQIRTLKGA